jgi:hypothetical protein
MVLALTVDTALDPTPDPDTFDAAPAAPIASLGVPPSNIAATLMERDHADGVPRF